MGYRIIPCEANALSAAIDAGAQAAQREQKPRARPKGFRASGLPYCLRQRGYEVQGVPPDGVVFVPDYDLAAAQGTTIHARMQAWLAKSGLLVEWPGFGPAVELPLSVCCPEGKRALLNEVGFSGHIDAVLQHRGALSILDIKTVASKYLARDEFDCENPWLEQKLQGYAVQVSAYMAFCGLPDGRRPEAAFILMISRDDTSVRRLYRVPWCEDAFNTDLARLMAAHRAVSEGLLPVAEPDRGPCMFCGWRVRCESERCRGSKG